MILPIVAYGDPVLKTKAQPLTKDYPYLSDLIKDMFETMYNAKGVGLAAPQVGYSIRLFIVDGAPFEEDEEVKNFKQVFINARVVKEKGDRWKFNEGCLSIPGIREDILRMPEIELEYEDENFQKHRKIFRGVVARIIQHEYDHIEGVLFTDRVSAMRRRLLKNSLLNISKGKVEVEYKMKFPLMK